MAMQLLPGPGSFRCDSKAWALRGARIGDFVAELTAEKQQFWNASSIKSIKSPINAINICKSPIQTGSDQLHHIVICCYLIISYRNGADSAFCKASAPGQTERQDVDPWHRRIALDPLGRMIRMIRMITLQLSDVI